VYANSWHPHFRFFRRMRVLVLEKVDMLPSHGVTTKRS
jgi:hypothetical protein